MRLTSRLTVKALKGPSGPSRISKALELHPSSGAGKKRQIRQNDSSLTNKIKQRGTPSPAKSDRHIDGARDETKGDIWLADKKWQSRAPTATFTPFYKALNSRHRAKKKLVVRKATAGASPGLKVLHHEKRAPCTVEEVFKDPNTPETVPFVLEAMMVAVLSQAASWNKAKLAMNNMKTYYGSVFAYENIVAGGRQKLENTLRCGGFQVEKSMLIFSMLQQVQKRRGKWDFDYLHNPTNEEAMKELLRCIGVEPTCPFVALSWCLKQDHFTVDTYVLRIAGLWGMDSSKSHAREGAGKGAQEAEV